MKYRFKLYLSFLFIAFFAAFGSILPILIEVRGVIFRAFSSQALTVAASLSTLLDPTYVKQIRYTQDDKLPAYRKIQTILNKERDIQRKHQVLIEEITLVFPKDRNTLVVLVDAPIEPKKTIPLGTQYVEKGPRGENIAWNALFSPKGFVEDRYGRWLLGVAPIIDAEGNYLATLIVRMKKTIVVSSMRKIVLYGVGFFLFSLLTASFISFFLGKHLSISICKLIRSTNKIKKGDLHTPIFLSTNDEFHQLALSMDEMRKGLLERDHIKKTFSRYVSKPVLDKILEEKAEISLQGESRKITVLFADIRGFTKLAEDLCPEKVVCLLNEYFGYMLDTIFAHKGTLDKFIGDGIMVEFGSPLHDPDQEKRAVNCAIAMQKTIAFLLKKWAEEKKPLLQIGIGIHTGHAIVGNIGTEERMEYTAIGDAVNVAARIEKKTKDFKAPILVSEDTKSAIENDFSWKDLGYVELRGRKQPIKVFTLEQRHFL